MVKTLHQANVNTLWEHALSDKNHKKKPIPKDPMYTRIFYIIFVIAFLNHL